MSADDFKFGNSLFRELLDSSQDLITPKSNLAKFSEVAGVIFPTSQEEAVGLAKKALLSTKKKAAILVKLFPGRFKHTESLNIVSNMCFFRGWKDFSEYAGSFSKLSDGQRKTSGDSLKLLMALWNPSSNKQDEFVLHAVSLSTLMLSRVTGLGHDDAYDAAKKIFGNDNVGLKDEYLEVDEVLSLIRTIHEDPVRHYLMASLSHTPIKDGRPVIWPDLCLIDVGKFFSRHILVSGPKGKFPTTVQEFITASVMGGIHDFAESGLHVFINAMFEKDRLFSERSRIINSLASDKTRDSVKKAITTLYAGVKSESVLDTIKIHEGYDGFYYENFSKRVFSGFDKAPINELPINGGINISIYRDETFRPDSNAGARFVRVTAIARDISKNVVGYIQLKYIRNASGMLNKLCLVADEIEDRDAIEMSLSLTEGLGRGYKGVIKDVALVCRWEVIREFRGMGIGKSLLASAFNNGPSGFNIEKVIARVEPHEYPIPPLDGTDLGFIPNYSVAHALINKVWDSVTDNGSRFGDIRSSCHKSGYMDVCHGHPNLLMLAMFNADFY